jgi:hypothetical protein
MVDFLSTETDLCNLALGHIAAKSISALTEKSKEAEQCRIFYGTALGFVLSDHDYKFASTKIDGVAVPVDVGGPTSADLDGWQYLYAYPANCVKVREIITANQMQSIDPYGFGNVNGAAFGVPDSQQGNFIAPSNSFTLSNERGFGDDRGPDIPFNVALIGTTKYIFCDVPDARIRYTRFMDNVTGCPFDFALVFSYYLASLIAFPITRKLEMTGAMMKSYENMKPQVQANNQNEATQVDRDPPAPWIRARQGD